jgi:endonuclease/exonuclease/phosphatase family metal-dependent hydrolase
VVFLQEVQGMHLRHAQRHADWPGQPQHEFLARDVWQQTAYGGNAIYDHGHHGNAILAATHPVPGQQDVSDHRFESRGLLHCEVKCRHRAPGALRVRAPGPHRRQPAPPDGRLVARLDELAPTARR